MMNNKNLKSEYQKLQQQAAPDLWDRIESELQPHEASDDLKQPYIQPEAEQSPAGPAVRKRRTPYYGAAAAALVCLVMAGRLMTATSSKSTLTTEYDAAGQLAAAETEAETADAAEPNAKMAAADALDSETALVLTNSLRVPEQAVTVPADAQYFSEAILQETNLLCGVRVMDVSLGYDESGKANQVIYELTISNVYYAEDYVKTADTITVTSPIVKTDGDEAFILYQMQIGETYLLPLKEQQEGFELLYPFAPQIQMAGEHQYRFHSGYTSLITEQTVVVKAEQEGANDFYYDRMLSRDDETFLSDLISLIQ